MAKGLFNLPTRTSKSADFLLAKKAKKVGSVTTKGKNNLFAIISEMTATVEKNLGKYRDKYKLVVEEAELEKYLDKAILTGILSIDTETSGLDPLTDKIAGLCLYTPGEKAIYVPINHLSYVTGIKVADQLTEGQVSRQLQKIANAKIKLIFFNAKFDMRFIKHQLGVELKPYWDGFIAAKLLNENELDSSLKTLHKKYVLKNEEDAFKFDDLFKGLSFPNVPLNVAYLYAARDAEITYELYKFQEPFLTTTNEICKEKDLEKVAKIFHEIEMPLITVVAKMEDVGISFDFEIAKQLSIEYNQKLQDSKDNFYKICDKYNDLIDKYRQKSGANCKLAVPINIASPDQLAILLYDILKLNSKQNGRGTGEDILETINHPIASAILEYRGIAKLLSTYIDKMPLFVNPTTQRIHTNFNQLGTVTGRFSSSNPNMQNIPSKNKEIRKIFKATEGYLLISSDYSAQEPRITAHMSNDPKMISAYKEGKDLYAEMASLAFNLPYEECKEFRIDETFNAEGKIRRNMAKAIFLGICYGKEMRTIGNELGVTAKKAEDIYNSVINKFDGLRQFMTDCEKMARELGFVTTLWGRKRRLPNMQLPTYSFSLDKTKMSNFDPLFDEEDKFEEEVSEETIRIYLQRLNKAYGFAAKKNIIEHAKKNGIIIKDNSRLISDTIRQCVNSRIQGSAADQTKKAMILIGNDEKLKSLGFRLLLTVHDELIAECPEENIKVVSKRFAELMVQAADELIIPSKCDVEITKNWYGKSLSID